jgi:hypothetical protein
MDEGRTLLRHALATLAYRAAKTLRDAPEGFAGYSPASSLPASTVRTPLQIVAHMCDLIEWSLSAASGADVRHDSAPLQWARQIARFFAALERLDGFLAATADWRITPARLLQGPIADALTHVGQLALQRREFGSPIAPESFIDADIAVGRVGFDQPAPRK